VEHALNVLGLLEGVDAFEHLGRLVLGQRNQVLRDVLRLS
jgi:hypothetical protein